MKTILLFSMTLLFVTSLTAQSQKHLTTQQAAEQYIRDSESEWAESVASGDTKAVERILAEDFVGVDPKGNSYKKAQMISDTRTAPKYFASNHIDFVTVRFYGDTAVAQGSESWVRQNGERGRFVWTDTWIRRRGQWQIVAAEDLVAAPLPAKTSDK